MHSIKIKKKLLLNWLNQGNTIEICSEPGPSFGKLITSKNCPISSQSLINTINRLFRDGKLSYETFYSLGMRYERYYLDEGGHYEKR